MTRAGRQGQKAKAFGRPETGLNFKLYRQATNKIVGVSAGAAAFLQRCFPPSGDATG